MKKLLLLTFLLCSFSLKANTEIVWLTDDPRDLSDLLLNKEVSIGTDSVNMVLKRLGPFTLDLQLASLARTEELLLNTDNACIGNRLKTPHRIATNLFSKAVNIHPGLRLYYLQSHLEIPPHLLNSRGQLISLNALFNELQDKKLGIAQQRSFGLVLDEQIAKMSRNNIAMTNGSDRYNQISRLFFRGLVDFIIDFPSQVNIKIKQFGQQDNIVSLEVADVEDYLVSYIGCSKSATGEVFITAVNEILSNPEVKSLMYQTHMKYLPDSEAASFTTKFEQIFDVSINN